MERKTARRLTKGFVIAVIILLVAEPFLRTSKVLLWVWFGVLIALLIAQTAVSLLTRCPHCKGQIPVYGYGEFCPRCGRKIEE